MGKGKTWAFSATIDIIGINPFVHLPPDILAAICKVADKDKGPIPIKGAINGEAYRQTLVKYSGAWRLYINTVMLKNSPKRIGETIQVTIAFDPDERVTPIHPKLAQALAANKAAKATFDKLPASRQHEIVRYIAHLKTEASVDRNVAKAIDFLNGKARFVGRDKP